MKRFFLAAIVAVAMVSGVQAQNVKVGDKLADFTLTSVNGEPVSLSQFKGQVVLVDFLGVVVQTVSPRESQRDCRIQQVQKQEVQEGQRQRFGCSERVARYR